MYPVRCCRGTAVFDCLWDVDDVDRVVDVWSDNAIGGGFVSDDDVSVDDSDETIDVLVVVIEFVAAELWDWDDADVVVLLLLQWLLGWVNS